LWEAREREEFQVTLVFLLEQGEPGFLKGRQSMRKVQDRNLCHRSGMMFVIYLVNIQ